MTCERKESPGIGSEFDETSSMRMHGTFFGGVGVRAHLLLLPHDTMLAMARDATNANDRATVVGVPVRRRIAPLLMPPPRPASPPSHAAGFHPAGV